MILSLIKNLVYHIINEKETNKSYFNPFFVLFLFFSNRSRTHTRTRKKREREKEWLTMCCSNEKEKKNERAKKKFQLTHKHSSVFAKIVKP
jgi:hypothetical protein